MQCTLQFVLQTFSGHKFLSLYMQLSSSQESLPKKVLGLLDWVYLLNYLYILLFLLLSVVTTKHYIWGFTTTHSYTHSSKRVPRGCLRGPLDDIFASSQLHFSVYLITFSTFLFRPMGDSKKKKFLPPSYFLARFSAFFPSVCRKKPLQLYISPSLAADQKFCGGDLTYILLIKSR